MKCFYIFFSWWQLILFDGLMVVIAWFLAHWFLAHWFEFPLTFVPVLAPLPLVVLIQVGALIVSRVYRVPWLFTPTKPTGSWGRLGKFASKFNRKSLPGTLVGALFGFMVAGALGALLFGVLGYYLHSKIFHRSTRDIVLITGSVLGGMVVSMSFIPLFRVPYYSQLAFPLHAVLLIGLLMTSRLLYRAYQTRKK